MANTNILLESGTNELEVLEFSIGGNSFGINVAKVRELMRYVPPQSMPNSHPCIEGIFQPREEVYTVLNLPMYLGISEGDREQKDNDIYVIASFNSVNVAFHVHKVETIHRISWEAIEKPDNIVYSGEDGVVTGIAKIGDRIISILDFEKIVFDISPQTGIQLSDIDDLGNRTRSEIPILIAEDSALLRRMLLEALVKAGYSNVVSTSNGAEAWARLEEFKSKGDELASHVSLVITDIEMPQMDGLHLTKLIKDDPILGSLPVVVFSSLIDENMKLKCKEVGSDAQLSKPDISNLVIVIDELLRRSPLLS